MRFHQNPQAMAVRNTAAISLTAALGEDFWASFYTDIHWNFKIHVCPRNENLVGWLALNHLNSTRCRIFDRCAVCGSRSRSVFSLLAKGFKDPDGWQAWSNESKERRPIQVAWVLPPIFWVVRLNCRDCSDLVELLGCCLRRITVKHRWFQSKAALSWNLLAPSEYPPFSLDCRNKCSSLTVWVFLQK